LDERGDMGAVDPAAAGATGQPVSPCSDPSVPLAVPLAVDVDGTLLRTDLLHEAMLRHVADHPLRLPRMLGWLTGGKAAFKARLADHASPHIESLPLRAETLALIRQAQDEGRAVWLASASDHRYVSALAARIGGIAGVLASTPDCNLAGPAKAAALDARFGVGGYDYVGDRPVDFAVWDHARRPLVVAASAGFERQVRARFPGAEVIARPRPQFARYVKALRPHQWAKNLLVFLAMIAGHDLRAEALVATLVAFACFCLAASSAYIINDLLDLPGDRQHPTKCRRPLAAGDILVSEGLVLSAVLMGASLLLALLLPARFLLILGAYVAITLGYSLVLKRRMVIDVITLGALYTIRVFGGLVAAQEKQSQWLVMFSLFLFLALALVKRCSELVMLREAGREEVVGRAYRVADLAVLFPAAAAAGYGAILVVALYLQSPEVVALYAHPSRLWLLYPPLLYWITRVILLSSRNQLHDDPVVFALTDRASWAVGAMCAAVVALAI
jgi:4-hydroxybenzoate polyprenyltransferase